MPIQIIQTLNPAVLKTLVRIHATALPHQCWDEIALTGISAQEGHHLRIAVDNNHAIGFVLWRQVLDEAELLTIAVAPDHQRNGIGQLLLSHMLGDASFSPVKQCFLEVADDNAAAQHFYLKNKFTVSGRRKAYYGRGESPPVDAVLMCRDF